MSITIEHIIDMTVTLFLIGCIFAGLVWAAEKEKELGIHGKSSAAIGERLEK